MTWTGSGGGEERAPDEGASSPEDALFANEGALNEPGGVAEGAWHALKDWLSGSRKEEVEEKAVEGREGD